MGRILKSYILWTHERGSFHYDVMVSLILAFIFATPFLWSYGDRPQPAKLAADSIVVKVTAPGNYVYVVPAADVEGDAPLNPQLHQEIRAISGAVTLDRVQPVKESGKVTAYRVWAHR